MIIVNHKKLYDESFSPGGPFYRTQRSYSPSSIVNEYFFRNVDGNIVKAFNTKHSLDQLTNHFQSVLNDKNSAHCHIDYYVETDDYPSKNMEIYNGFYMISNSELEQTDSDQLFGLIDTLGQVVLEPIYNQILLLPKGFLIRKDGKWGMITIKQEKILLCEYDHYETEFYYFDNNHMDSQLMYLIKNGRYKVAYFMKQDSLIFLKDYYQELEPKKGLFVVKEKEKYGIINLVKNEILAPPIYESNFRFHHRQFYDREHGDIIAIKNGKYGMINLRNKVILPFIYDKIYTEYESRKGYFKVAFNGKDIEIAK